MVSVCTFCNHYWVELFAPYLIGDFLYQRQLRPLFLFTELVANFAGSKATLWAQGQAIQWHILFCFVNARNHFILIFQLWVFSGYQAQNDLLVAANLGKRFKPTGTFIVKFKIVGINILATEKHICYRVISATAGICRVEIPAANVGIDS